MLELDGGGSSDGKHSIIPAECPDTAAVVCGMCQIQLITLAPFWGPRGLPVCLGNCGWDLTKPVPMAGTMVELKETTLTVPNPGGGSKEGRGSAPGSCLAPLWVSFHRGYQGQGHTAHGGASGLLWGHIHQHSEQLLAEQ